MEEYKEFLKRMSAFLAKSDFVRRGYFFIKDTPDFYQIIHFDKSKHSTPQQVFFSVGMAVTSKKTLEQKKFRFLNNAMHNQWQDSLDYYVSDKKVDYIEITAGQKIDALTTEIENIFSSTIFQKLDRFSDNAFLIDYLLNCIKHGDLFSNVDVEDALILTVAYYPDRIAEVLETIIAKARDSNDRLFINSLLKDLAY